MVLHWTRAIRLSRTTLQRAPVTASPVSCGSATGVPHTGVPRSKETASPQDPMVGLCLAPFGGPGGGGLLVMSKVPL